MGQTCHLTGVNIPIYPEILPGTNMPNTSLIEKLASGNLVKQIAVGIVAGIVLALVWPTGASGAMLLGHLFVQALKAVAPILVLVLVASALANQEIGNGARLRPIVGLYLAATFSAALLAVVVSSLFPTDLVLTVSRDRDVTAPGHHAGTREPAVQDRG